MQLPYASTLAHVLREAEDIGRATGRKASSAHVLLAFFTTRNQAERILRDRRINEDLLLDQIEPDESEPAETLREIIERAAQVAAGCGTSEVDCLHVLVAMTRVRSSQAYRMLDALDENVNRLRTRALTILTGAVPRWMNAYNKRADEEVEVHSSLPQRARDGRDGSGLPLPAPKPLSRLPNKGGGRASRDLLGRTQALRWNPPLLMNNQKSNKRTSHKVPAGSILHDSTFPAVRGRSRTSTKPGSRPASRPGAEERRLKTDALSSKPPPARPQKPAASVPPKTRPERPARPPTPAPSAPRAFVKPAPKPALVPAPEPELQSELPMPLPVDTDPAEPWLLTPTTYPWLTSLGRNLSAEAARGELDRLIGRSDEVDALIDILGKRRSNNPVLIGEPGVGKTAVVEGLAARLVRAENNRLRQKIVISLDVGALLIGTHLRGSFSEKLQGLKDEVRASDGRVIVFFDELHTLVGAGSSGDGPQDAANELKAALARGQFPCIGATTCDEYVKHIEPDSALKRRFVPVLIKEPAPTEAIQMIELIISTYGRHHGVSYTPESIVAAVNLSSRYITDRYLPDKAISTLDLAGSRAARAGLEEVDKRLVAELLSSRIDLPVERLLASDRERLLHLEAQLQRSVIGHQAQLKRIAEVVRRNAAGFHTQRPQGSFLFVGPTGVGKTETAKALSKLLHGDESSLIRIDLSEFSEAHSVARLVGAPPGYVGYEAGGQLTEMVRKKPGRIVLFDEIEKAHRDVLQLLLQILDEGRLTDGHGRTVSFGEAIIIMTSNLGSNLAKASRQIGFASGHGPQLEDQVLATAKENLSPELWGRIEEKLVFAPLARDEVKAIARLLAQDSSQRLMDERGISYELDEEAIDFLLDQGGFDLSLGARPMRHILARIVEGPIAARILEGRLHADEHVLVSTRENGGLAFLVGDDRMSLSQRPPRAD